LVGLRSIRIRRGEDAVPNARDRPGGVDVRRGFLSRFFLPILARPVPSFRCPGTVFSHASLDTCRARPRHVRRWVHMQLTELPQGQVKRN
jgi:hypothetical protein